MANGPQSDPVRVEMDPFFAEERREVEEALCFYHAEDITLQMASVKSIPQLERFLIDYEAHLLIPRELPAILQGYLLAQKGKFKELLELDKQLASDPQLKQFAVPSCFVGKRQLRKLKPLKDLRGVQRYLDAVLAGQAHGWHTLVYGVVIAIYSIPLRQGLHHYGQQTLSKFIGAAGKNLHMSEADSDRLHQQLWGALPQAVEKLIKESLPAPDGCRPNLLSPVF